MFIFGLIVGIFVGHVLFHPKRREDFISALDVNSIKKKELEEKNDGNSTDKGRRSTKD